MRVPDYVVQTDPDSDGQKLNFYWKENVPEWVKMESQARIWGEYQAGVGVVQAVIYNNHHLKSHIQNGRLLGSLLPQGGMEWI